MSAASSLTLMLAPTKYQQTRDSERPPPLHHGRFESSMQRSSPASKSGSPHSSTGLATTTCQAWSTSFCKTLVFHHSSKYSPSKMSFVLASGAEVTSCLNIWSLAQGKAAARIVQRCQSTIYRSITRPKTLTIGGKAENVRTPAAIMHCILSSRSTIWSCDTSSWDFFCKKRSETPRKETSRACYLKKLNIYNQLRCPTTS